MSRLYRPTDWNPTTSPYKSNWKLKLTQKQQVKQIGAVDYMLLADPARRYWFVHDLLKELPDPDNFSNFANFYKNTATKTKSTQFRHLAKEKEKNAHSKTNF